MNFKAIKKYIIICLLISCSTTYNIESFSNKSITVTEQADSNILAIIKPYQDNIENEMNEILTYTKYDLKKGKPESTIGNFVTDLCLEYTNADMCLMNNGGLRTSIYKGNITKGKIYELMPFENELVIVELNEQDFLGLLNYIISRGGEPFSGIQILAKNNTLIKYTSSFEFNNKKNIRVLTSDYLANGGDKMWFFDGKKQEKIGVKVRDAIINYCIKNDTIKVQLDNRIQIESGE
jgi:2',3'-cyclic-nucleotide 2'-phosphodiesterase (5'-nucleotidase family)